MVLYLVWTHLFMSLAVVMNSRSETLRRFVQQSRLNLTSLTGQSPIFAICRLSPLLATYPRCFLCGERFQYGKMSEFRKYVRLDGDVVAQLTVSLLNLKGPTLLALDRPNWKLGKTDINIPVLVILIELN